MKKTVVLVIRPADDFSYILKQNGFEVFNLPLIHTEPAADLSELEEKLRSLDEYDGLFFTSPAAAEVFLGKVEKTTRFSGKVYAMGERTKACFGGAGFELALSENANTAEEFIRSFDAAEFTDKNFLFVRGDKSMRTIPRLLRGTAVVEEIVVYKTVDNPISTETLLEISNKIDNGEIDWICFFSPSAIDAVVKLFKSEAARNINTAVIGETTADRAREARMNLQLISKRANALDFANSLARHVKQID